MSPGAQGLRRSSSNSSSELLRIRSLFFLIIYCCNALVAVYIGCMTRTKGNDGTITMASVLWRYQARNDLSGIQIGEPLRSLLVASELIHSFDRSAPKAWRPFN